MNFLADAHISVEMIAMLQKDMLKKI